MRLKRSHKTNPEVVWRRPDLDVYRAATRRRKDVRVSSKYLKISSRNAGDPLLIKTAGSTCAFPGLLRNPPPPYIYIYIYLSVSLFPLSLSSIRARDLSTSLVIIFREELAKGTRDCCHWIIGFGRFLFFFLPFFFFPHLFSHLALMESRENIVYSVLYIYMCVRSKIFTFGFGNWSLGRTGDVFAVLFSFPSILGGNEVSFRWRFVYVCIPEVAIIRILKVSYEVARVIHGCAVCFYTVYTRGPA